MFYLYDLMLKWWNISLSNHLNILYEYKNIITIVNNYYYSFQNVFWIQNMLLNKLGAKIIILKISPSIIQILEYLI